MRKLLNILVYQHTNLMLCPKTELIKLKLLHTSKCFECVYIKISFVFVSPFHFRQRNCCSWHLCMQGVEQQYNRTRTTTTTTKYMGWSISLSIFHKQNFRRYHTGKYFVEDIRYLFFLFSRCYQQALSAGLICSAISNVTTIP